MSLADWPPAERPRERLLAQGAASLSDAELVALFLGTGVRGKSAVAVARELLARFGRVSRLLAASQAEFAALPGVGDARYARIAAVILAHNHPSGVAEPSIQDQALTRTLAEALALVDIKVLDHFIVAPGASLSFAERGLL